MDLAPFSNLLPSLWRHNPPRQFVPPPHSWTNLNLALFPTKQRAETHFRWWSRNCDPDWITEGGGEGRSVDKAVKLINAVLMKCYRWSSLHKPWSLEGDTSKGWERKGDSKGCCLLKLNGSEWEGVSLR